MAIENNSFREKMASNGSCYPCRNNLLFSILLVDDVCTHFAKFLSTKEMLGVYAVSTDCRDLLTKNEELLFEYYIERDFVEGSVLSYVAKKRHLVYKVCKHIRGRIILLQFHIDIAYMPLLY